MSEPQSTYTLTSADLTNLADHRSTGTVRGGLNFSNLAISQLTGNVVELVGHFKRAADVWEKIGIVLGVTPDATTSPPPLTVTTTFDSKATDDIAAKVTKNFEVPFSQLKAVVGTLSQGQADHATEIASLQRATALLEQVVRGEGGIFKVLEAQISDIRAALIAPREVREPVTFVEMAYVEALKQEFADRFHNLETTIRQMTPPEASTDPTASPPTPPRPRK
jgi:hypothetical protein